MHTRWVNCTPWPHVTEHEVPALTQLYVSTVGCGCGIAVQETSQLSCWVPQVVDPQNDWSAMMVLVNVIGSY
jgi:hypothetical protein